ncbi:MAG: Dabb family protein [candidate division FCPU426 bacterium]
MIKHIVLWKLKPENRLVAKVKELRGRLEALQEKIPLVVNLEVGVNLASPHTSHDVALCTEFRNLADLEAYRVHPEHQAVAAYVRDLVEERASVDYVF